MRLERFKQGYPNLPRKYGVHGIIYLNHKSIGGSRVIYTLESFWEPTKDEPNGALGRSCVNEGSYTVSVEESPVTNKKYPFIFNESLGVALRNKNNANNKTGHALVDLDVPDPLEIYGRFIVIGRTIEYDPRGFYYPQRREEAVDMLNRYIEASGDKKLIIGWKK